MTNQEHPRRHPWRWPFTSQPAWLGRLPGLVGQAAAGADESKEHALEKPQSLRGKSLNEVGNKRILRAAIRWFGVRIPRLHGRCGFSQRLEGVGI